MIPGRINPTWENPFLINKPNVVPARYAQSRFLAIVSSNHRTISKDNKKYANKNI